MNVVSLDHRFIETKRPLWLNSNVKRAEEEMESSTGRRCDHIALDKAMAFKHPPPVSGPMFSFGYCHIRIIRGIRK